MPLLRSSISFADLGLPDSEMSYSSCHLPKKDLLVISINPYVHTGYLFQWSSKKTDPVLRDLLASSLFQDWKNDFLKRTDSSQAFEQGVFNGL